MDPVNVAKAALVRNRLDRPPINDGVIKPVPPSKPVSDGGRPPTTAQPLPPATGQKPGVGLPPSGVVPQPPLPSAPATPAQGNRGGFGNASTPPSSPPTTHQPNSGLNSSGGSDSAAASRTPAQSQMDKASLNNSSPTPLLGGGLPPRVSVLPQPQPQPPTVVGGRPSLNPPELGAKPPLGTNPADLGGSSLPTANSSAVTVIPLPTKSQLIPLLLRTDGHVATPLMQLSEESGQLKVSLKLLNELFELEVPLDKQSRSGPIPLPPNLAKQGELWLVLQNGRFFQLIWWPGMAPPPLALTLEWRGSGWSNSIIRRGLLDLWPELRKKLAMLLLLLFCLWLLF